MTVPHPPILGTQQWHWPDEAACAAQAAVLAAQSGLADAFIALHGPLGAGKTTFTRHLLRALGVTGRIKSPSYALMETYRVGERPMAHCDFYRFGDPAEFVDAGLRDVFAAPGLKLVEWPEKAGDLLPRPDLALHLEPTGEGDARQVRADAFTPRGLDLLA
ncbi:ATPase, YjeE family [Burkholderiales bacterium JOSHI_001]|nr:ATPase, YjeE family [Burkholderiales bacterium JOSHI_001]